MLQKTSDVHHMFTPLNAESEALDNKRVSTVECYFLALKVTLQRLEQELSYSVHNADSGQQTC